MSLSELEAVSHMSRRRSSGAVINYRRVAKAIKKYQKIGYTYIDTPWLVSDEAMLATLPSHRKGFELGHSTLKPGKLVGSAEQGFIQLMLDEKIQPGNYVSAGPCFRDEENVDALHQYAFFKVELIQIIHPRDPMPTHGAARVMANDADEVLYNMYGPGAQVVRTPEGWDIEVEGVEIGSYGVREYKGHRWVYGTGLALPRTHIAYKVRE